MSKKSGFSRQWQDDTENCLLAVYLKNIPGRVGISFRRCEPTNWKREWRYWLLPCLLVPIPFPAIICSLSYMFVRVLSQPTSPSNPKHQLGWGNMSFGTKLVIFVWPQTIHLFISGENSDPESKSYSWWFQHRHPRILIAPSALKPKRETPSSHRVCTMGWRMLNGLGSIWSTSINPQKMDALFCQAIRMPWTVNDQRSVSWYPVVTQRGTRWCLQKVAKQVRSW